MWDTICPTFCCLMVANFAHLLAKAATNAQRF